MSEVVKNRVRQGTTTVGTITYVIDVGAPDSYQPFSQLGDGNTTTYLAFDDNDWEVGKGTYSAGTLTRDTIYASSNVGAKVNWGNGEKTLEVVYPAERAVMKTSSTALVSGRLPLVTTDGMIKDTDSFFWSESGNNPLLFIDATQLSGDALLKLKDGAGKTWSVGADSSAGTFVIAASAALGTTNAVSITPAGAMTVTGTATISGTGTSSIAGLLDISGASAGNIKFPSSAHLSADANTLDDYREAVVTPIDSSGAGLTFTSVSGKMTKIGRLVVQAVALTFPSTADGTTVSIGGLLVSTTATVCDRQGFLTQSTESTAKTAMPATSATTFTIQAAAGAAITNATMSTDSIKATLQYTEV